MCAIVGFTAKVVLFLGLCRFVLVSATGLGEVNEMGLLREWLWVVV